MRWTLISATSQRRETMTAIELHPIPQEKRFLLFLTPVEDDIWTCAQLIAQEHEDELIVDIAVDHSTLMHLRCASNLASSTEEYHRAIRKLLKSGILSEKGLTAKGTKMRYAFAIRPEAFLVKSISSRAAISRERLHIQSESLVQTRCVNSDTNPTKEDILEIIRTVCRELYPDEKKADIETRTLPIYLLAGYFMQEFSFFPGMFVPVTEGDDRFAVAYPGYESCRLYDEQNAPKLGATLVIIPNQDEADTSISLYLTPVSKTIPHGEFEDLIPQTTDGEFLNDLMCAEDLARLSSEDLKSRVRLYQSLASHAAVWLSRTEQALEIRKCEQEKQEREAREFAELQRQLDEAERVAREAEQRRLQLMEQIGGKKPPRRYGRPFIICESCKACPAIPGECKCRDCM